MAVLNENGIYGSLVGTVDPSAGSGVAAGLPNLYFRTNGTATEVWAKTGAADTAWTQLTSNDPIFSLFGTPNTAFEFDTSSLAGLTLHGTPDFEDANTTVAGHYYIRDDAAGAALCGRSIAPPATPYTFMAKVTDAAVRADFNAAGIFLSVDPPGAIDFHSVASATRNIRVERFTNLTTFSASIANLGTGYDIPMYFAIRVNTSTNVDYLYSTQGRIWTPASLTRNPAIVIGRIGVMFKAQNALGCSAAFDWFRVWNSALTFPGV